MGTDRRAGSTGPGRRGGVLESALWVSAGSPRRTVPPASNLRDRSKLSLRRLRRLPQRRALPSVRSCAAQRRTTISTRPTEPSGGLHGVPDPHQPRPTSEGVLQPTETRDHPAQRRHSRTNGAGPRDWIAIPCPSIIDDTAFEAARSEPGQLEMESRNLPKTSTPGCCDAWSVRSLRLARRRQKIVQPRRQSPPLLLVPHHADARVARHAALPERNIRADTSTTSCSNKSARAPAS